MLLRSYNRHVRPVKRDADPLQVHVAFSLVEVLSIDENNGQLAVKAWLTMASLFRFPYTQRQLFGYRVLSQRLIIIDKHHRVNVSPSPVLTATHHPYGSMTFRIIFSPQP